MAETQADPGALAPRIATAAIEYEITDTETTGPQLLGRRVANRGFVGALARHGRSGRYYCFSRQGKSQQDFNRLVSAHTSKEPFIGEIRSIGSPLLREAGCLFQLDPAVAAHASARRASDQRAFSLCGITHSLAEREVLSSLAALLTAPLQRWDALVCTSSAIRGSTDALLSSWGEYLRQRLCATAVEPAVQLPVIPLGVETEAYPTGVERERLRDDWRRRLGVARDDVLVLSVGRLSYKDKANPTPLWLALERVARDSRRKIHLVSAGWFPSGGTEEAYRNGAAALCRSFQWTFLDGREPGVRRTLWAAADIFVSLVDNIQESFGLVPLEAMSNGLPVVVSDWDGYKDTVRDGVDGWRIRTVVPPGGSGVELAQSYVEGLVTYEDYVGNASLATCVDVEAAAGAIKRLVDDEILRARLGQAGRQRALDTYDWRHVIPQYEELWGHLAELRQSEQEIAPRPSCESGHPARPDPFALYRAFATSVLADNSILSFASADPGGDYDRVCTLTLNAYGLVVLGTEQARRGVLALLIQNLPCSVAEILALGSGSGAPQLRRILVWLAKCGVIRVAAGPGPENALEGPS